MATFLIVHDLLAGFPDAVSGTAWFYYPNTTSPLPIFGDADGTAITNPVTLDVNGAATVYLNRIARMIVQTALGVTLVDCTINKDSDVTSANTSGAFTGDTQKDVNDTALTAFGGVNFQYVPSGAYVGMTPRDWMNGLVRNVMAYGSVGATQVNGGVTPADSALAGAIADAAGGRVYMPPGTYLLNNVAAINTTGVTIEGAGIGVTTILVNSATNNGFTVTSANGTEIRNLHITSASASSGTAIAATGVTGLTLTNVKITRFYVSTSFTTCSDVTINGNSNFNSPSAAGAAGRNVVLSSTDNARVIGITAGAFGASSFAFDFLGTGNNVAVIGTAFSSTGVNFDSGLTGVGYRFIGNYMGNIAVPFTVGAAALPQWFENDNNNADGYSITAATGGVAVTPNYARGSTITVNVSSGGAGALTINAPTHPPAAADLDKILTLKLINAAGGAVTYTLNAAFVLVGAAQPSGTDNTTVVMVFMWDGTKWRERSRAQTAT